MESEALSSGANSIRIVGHVVSKCGGGGVAEKLGDQFNTIGDLSFELFKVLK